MAEKLTVYFACAIKGEQGGEEEKRVIVETIKGLGHRVNSEIFVEQNAGNNQLHQSFTPEGIYQQDIDLIEEADIIVADVTRVSTGIGFETGWQLRGGGRVVALCIEDRYEGLSNMIKGCNAPGFSLHTWRGMDHQEDLTEILERQLGRVDD